MDQKMVKTMISVTRLRTNTNGRLRHNLPMQANISNLSTKDSQFSPHITRGNPTIISSSTVALAPLTKLPVRRNSLSNTTNSMRRVTNGARPSRTLTISRTDCTST